MPDLADLGIRVRSEEVAVADERLDDFTASAMRAENAAESFGSATRASGAGVSTMTTAVRQQNAVLVAARNATGLTSQETLNLSRQFADVGVSIASGMPIWMVAIQQGSQIGDTFQTASMRGVGFMAVIRGVAASLGGLLLVAAPVVAVAGAVAGGFALMHREMSKGVPKDITDGLNLTEEQLKKVESRTVTFGDTVMATFTVAGRYIMNGPVGEGLDWLGEKFTQIFDWISRTVFEAATGLSGVMVGSYRTIRDTWRDLPAVFGDVAITASNNVIRALTALVNRASGLLNGFIIASNLITGGNLPRIPNIDAPEITNRFAGAGRAQGQAWAANVLAARAEAAAGLRQFGADIEAEALARARRRAMEEAGDATGGRDRASRAPRERLAPLDDVQISPLTLRMDRLVDPLRLVAREMQLIDDLAQRTARGLEDAFGSSGRALGDLLTTMSSYQARLAEIDLAEREYRLNAVQAERERAMAQVQNYGDMVGAARGFFSEGSDGYQALLAVEQVYRAFQLASMIQAMALGQQETASSVANSMAKGTASMAAGAARMFEALGPWAFPAVAAMLGLLASLGLNGGGGGAKPARAANDNDSPDASTAAVRTLSARDAQSREAAAAAVAGKIDVRVTADRDGLNAYVVRTARGEAMSVAVPLAVATAAGTKRDTMASLEDRQMGNRRVIS